jgi:hypothetical protein
MYPLRLHCILKVPHSEPSVDCGCTSNNSYISCVYKGTCFCLKEAITHSVTTQRLLPPHTYTHNDLFSSFCSRLPLRSGCSCPSSGRQSFYWQFFHHPCLYHPFYDVFVDEHEHLLLVDSDSVHHDGIPHASKHFILSPVRKQQRLLVQLDPADSFGVSDPEQEWHFFLLLVGLLPQQQQQLLLLFEHSILIPTTLHFVLTVTVTLFLLSTQRIQTLPTPVLSQQRTITSHNSSPNPPHDVRPDLRQ